MKLPSFLIGLALLMVSVGMTRPAHAETVALDFAPPAVSADPPSRAESSAAEASLPGNSDSSTPSEVDSSRQTALSFTPPMPAATRAATPPPPRSAAVLPGAAPSVTALFAGGSSSLVARTVGHAEGTRSADGNKTRAYYGHTDPGNGVWNLGSFSFQHCREAAYQCTTPEEADTHQLRRLERQNQALQQRAQATGLDLSLEEELNGIDLANQAPLAALGTPGYIDLLKQARQIGLRGSDAVLWARVHSYWNPQQNRWDAPGLGNTQATIAHDQERRRQAIAQAMETYQPPDQAQDDRGESAPGS